MGDSSEKNETIPGPDGSSSSVIEEKAGKGEAEEKKNEAVSPDFNEIKDEKGDGEALDLNFLLDIPLDVTVELGKTKMIINDLLQLGQGSVLELPKLVGEPLEVLVNNKLVARGEPVMVNEKFGIRLTDIISPFERIEHLK